MPTLELKNVSKAFPLAKDGLFAKQEHHLAVDEVSLTVDDGKIVSLVGASGSGKSTVARITAGLLSPDSGQICLSGQDISKPGSSARKRSRKRIQMVFQSPIASMNPRKPILHQITEGLHIHAIGPKAKRKDAAYEALEMVGLQADLGTRYPHQLSGGQAQRAAIARSIVVRPEFLILDEAVASLDATVKAEIVGLIRNLQETLGLGCLFISHEMGVVRHVSDFVAVMAAGRIVERGTAAEIFETPKDPATKALIQSILPIRGVSDASMHQRRITTH